MNHSRMKYELVPIFSLPEIPFSLPSWCTGANTPRFRVSGIPRNSWDNTPRWGGWVSGPHNLSQQGQCWLGPGSFALGNSRVAGDAEVIGNSLLTDDSVVEDKAKLSSVVLRDRARVRHSAVVHRRTGVLPGLGPALEVSYFDVVLEQGVQVSGGAKLALARGSYLMGDKTRIRGNVTSMDNCVLQIDNSSVLEATEKAHLGLTGLVILSNVSILRTHGILIVKDAELHSQADYEDLLIRCSQ